MVRMSIMRFGLAALLLAACGTDGDDEMVDCAVVTGVDTFVVGLEKMGAMGTLDFKLMSIAPAPPARGDNDWTLQVFGLSSGVVGAPVDGATINVTPYMPAHMHSPAVTAAVTPTGMAGEYRLSPVNMWMQGVWEVTIRATTATTSDRAVYKFCIP